MSVLYEYDRLMARWKSTSLQFLQAKAYQQRTANAALARKPVLDVRYDLMCRKENMTVFGRDAGQGNMQKAGVIVKVLGEK